MSDRIFAIIWLVLCLAGLLVGWQIYSEYNYEPVGPRPFPLGILTLMILCALLLLVRRPDTVTWPGARILIRLAVMVVALLCYGWGFELFGFPLATILLTVCLALLFGARIYAALISGVLMGGILYFAFDRLLDVTLPVGVWYNAIFVNQ